MNIAQGGARAISFSENGAKNDSETTVAGAENEATLAIYIADLSAELATLAGRGGMPMLAYFLNLARVEAETRARDLGGYPIERRRR